ncbi:HAMP domain-containing histidine kinase [bacterium]|nr:MAG: HAMP domain-containing histidine kinase [bacterium]
MPARINTIAARIALAAIAIAVLVAGVVVGGVLLIGRATFEALMAQHGTAAATSYAMFDASVTRVVVIAAAIALVGALALAFVAARLIEQPLAEVAQAARRVATGSFGVRVTRPRSRELASLADSFNQMAAALEDQERHRRDLILNFAHELRTPLTNLHGYLSAMSEGVVAAGPGSYASLQEEVDRLRRLSRSLDILADGGRPSADLVEVDLIPILTGLVDLHRPAFAGRGLHVETRLPPRLRARANADALAQILSNLLQNAGRYTPQGGTVLVHAQTEQDSVLVSIANSGDGIPSEDLIHVFERFYRVDKSRDLDRGGAGIGLAVVKELVEAAGGRVGVESRPGQTLFWFRLPSWSAPFGAPDPTALRRPP